MKKFILIVAFLAMASQAWADWDFWNNNNHHNQHRDRGSNQSQPVSVPEPSSAILLGLGIAGVAAWKIKKGS